MQTRQLSPDEIKQLVSEAIKNPAAYAEIAATKMPEDLVHLINTLLITALIISNKELSAQVQLLSETKHAENSLHSQD